MVRIRNVENKWLLLLCSSVLAVLVQFRLGIFVQTIGFVPKLKETVRFISLQFSSVFPVFFNRPIHTWIKVNLLSQEKEKYLLQNMWSNEQFGFASPHMRLLYLWNIWIKITFDKPEDVIRKSCSLSNNKHSLFHLLL